MTELKIARGLQLPLDAATKTFGILAQRRKGKTYTASVMAEEMVAAKLPWVALDPTGAWWGLRAGADGGQKGGLPVYVFGGDHGDLPLERTAGKQIADLVVEHPGWYVLDFSHFESKEAERQLATDFAERFYRRKGRAKDPMHLFIDEADMFVPQQSPSGDKRMVGAFESIVRRGGIRGIGSTLISQRAAVVNKNVLEQIDVLITLRVVGPNDQKAIKAYVDSHGDPKVQAAMMDSLSGLQLGEAWVWEPGEDLFQRVTIRKRHTFNSSATPDGKTATEQRLADVDLDALRGKLDAAIAKAKAEDPKELQRQLAEERKRATKLERELERRPTEAVEVEKVVEIPVLANGAVDKLQDAIAAIKDALAPLQTVATEINTQLARVEGASNVAQHQMRERRRTEGRDRPRAGVGAPPVATAARPADADPPLAAGDIKLGKPERAILNVLAQFPAGRTRPQISLLTGYSIKSSSFSNALGRLRTASLISPAGAEPITITQEGEDLVDDVEPVPTGQELYLHWLGKLGRAERAILEVLYEAHPDGLSKEEISERSGYSATSSSFSNALGKLRTLELVRGFKASDDLFEAAIA